MRQSFFNKVADYNVTKKDFVGRDDNSIMQYTTDLKNVYIHVSEECVRSCFAEFCHVLFPFISNSSQIIVTGTKQLFVPVRYLFLTIKQLLKPFIIAPYFKEELCMLAPRLLFCFALCQRFFLEEFS